MVNAVRHKVKYFFVIGSYSWTTRSAEQIAGMIPNQKVEFLPSVLCKGFPQAEDFVTPDNRGAVIANKHLVDQLGGLPKGDHKIFLRQTTRVAYYPFPL